MRELVNYQSILQAKADVAEGVFSKYPSIAVDEVILFREINNTKVKTAMPEIMFYGIYSAGKSSIMNELIGEDKAPVSDIPTTDKVTYYEWQGYKLADTPGVAAPIEHENITQEHLKKADIVLFVVGDAGTYEKKENYERLKEIADSGKKIIIVINDKAGYMGTDDEALQLIKQKIDSNVRKVGIDNVDDKYCMVAVNANTARKGRLTDKQKLIELSGINELRDIILRELKRTSSFEVLRQAIFQMEKLLGKFMSELKADEDSELLIKMNQVLENFGKQKLAIRRQINMFIDRKMDLLAPELADTIWNNREDDEKLNKIIGDKLDTLYKNLEKNIQQQLEEAVAVLSMEFKAFVSIQVDSNSEELNSFRNILDDLNQLNIQLNDGGATQLIEKDKLNIDKLIDNPEMAEMVGSILLSIGKDVVSSLAKTSIGKSLAATSAGKVFDSATKSVMSKLPIPPLPVPTPIPWPVLIEGMRILFKILGSNDDSKQMEAEAAQRNELARQRLEAEKQARQEITQKCLYWVDNLGDELKAASDRAVNETLEVYEKPFRDELDNRREKGANLMNDIEKMRSLLNEYDILKIELGGN